MSGGIRPIGGIFELEIESGRQTGPLQLYSNDSLINMFWVDEE
jgi:hypothetical protein